MDGGERIQSLPDWNLSDCETDGTSPHLRSFRLESQSPNCQTRSQTLPPTDHLWGGDPTLALSQRFSRRNSISSDSDLGIDIERHCSSRKGLGDLRRCSSVRSSRSRTWRDAWTNFGTSSQALNTAFVLLTSHRRASLASAWRFSNRSAFSRERIVSIRICRGRRVRRIQGRPRSSRATPGRETTRRRDRPSP